MIILKRLSLVVMLCALSCCPLSAQSKGGASADVAKPHIYRPLERRKVGVVLSGGGAKGMAHIGALKVIEEAGIPIDYIVGTSMGSIIGGLYSMGYTPAQLDSIVRSQNWSFLLSDHVGRDDLSISEREAADRYVLSLPIGGDDVKNVKDGFMNVTGGLIKGRNIANMFSELTVGYHDSIDFNTLPTPFACVAQDIATGREIRFHSGVPATAMRASMAIPGAFTPVRLDTMVLVDGGMVNNYPVDVAREMGADIVIGVDVQNNLKTPDELTGTTTVLGQIINLMGSDTYKRNVDDTDAYIKVDVEGYSAASFTTAAIDTLIRRGEEAARRETDALAKVKNIIMEEGGAKSPADRMTRTPYHYTRDNKLHIREIRFEGIDTKDIKWLTRRFNLKADSEMSVAEIEKVTSALCANFDYSTATYKLPSHPDGGYTLHLIMSKKYERKLNVGVRYDSEETASMLLNITNTLHTTTPTMLALSARFGKRIALQGDVMVEPQPLRRFALSYRFEYNDADFSSHSNHNHASAFRYHKAELSYSNVWHRNIRYMLGLRYELYDFNDTHHPSTTGETGETGSMDDEHLFGAFVQMQYDSYDNTYFPMRGVQVQAAYGIYTDNMTTYDGYYPFSAIRGHIGCAIPVTSRFSVLPDVYGRFIIGKKSSYAKQNIIGGDVKGRYFTHQMPFTGINNIEVVERALLIGSMKLRQRMGSLHYLTLTANYALDAPHIERIFKEHALFGCGIGYGLDSMIGPLEASINFVNRKEVNYYINLGYKF